MFGERFLRASKIKLSEEAAAQHALVNEERIKLCELTNSEWCLTYGETFDKARWISFFQGAGIGIAGCVIGKIGYDAVRKLRDRKKEQEKEKEN